MLLYIIIMADVYSNKLCIPMAIILIILYSVPIMFDLYPSSDSYIGGVAFLGLWGVIILMILGVGLSVFYGTVCIEPKTVYRCMDISYIPLIGKYFTCNDYKDGLVFPEYFTDELKMKYITELSKVKDKRHVPWSEYNKTLTKLNQELYLQ